jgi:O-antigen/teichoic acid export membrane protein
MSIKSEAESSRQIKKGAVMAYITIAVNMLTGLIYTPWMVSLIGQSNYGLYTLSTSLIGMFIIDFGLSAAVPRFLSKYNAIDDQESINNLLGIIYKLFIFIDIIIAACFMIIFFFISDIYKQLTVDELEKLRVIFIISAVYSVFSLPFLTLNGILISYEKFVLQKACDLFNRIFIILTMFIALSSGLGLYTLVSVNAVAGLVTILLKYFIIKKNTPVRVNFNYKEKHVLNEIMGFSVWTFIISISELFIYNIMPTILGALAGSVSIANFGVATTLEAYVYTFSNAIKSMFLPKVSRIVTKANSSEELLSLMIKVGRIQLVIIGLIFVGFITIGKDFIILWMGKDFVKAYYCTIFLILPCLFEYPQQIAGVTVLAVNKVKIQSYICIGMALINVLLSIVLSGYIGEIGASIAVCTAFFFRIIAMNIMYYRVLKINVFRFFKECYLKMSIAFFLTWILVIQLKSYLIIGGWSGFFLKAMIITILYIVMNWFIALNQYEKSLFSAAFKKYIKIKHHDN